MGISNSHERVLNDLEKDELIVWRGKPKQGFQLVFEDLLIIPFILFFFLVGTIVIINFEPFPYFGIFFYIGGGIAVYKRYIKDILSRKNTEYIITSKKVILLKSGKFIIFPFERIKNITFKNHPFSFKYGSVIIGKEQNIFGYNNDSVRFPVREGLNLERDNYAIQFIHDYKEVYNLIKKKIEEFKQKSKD